MDLIFISSLANTNNLLAKFSSLLYKDTSKDRHGQRDDGGDQVTTVVSVPLLATETFSLQVLNTSSNGLSISHVVSSPGDDVGALFTGPVTGGEDGSLLAETKTRANISFKNKVVVDAASHVTEPHVNSCLTCCCVSSLGADKSLQNLSLFSQAGFRQQTVNKSSCSRLAFFTGDSIGAGSRGVPNSSEEDQELHCQIVWSLLDWQRRTQQQRGGPRTSLSDSVELVRLAEAYPTAA